MTHKYLISRIKAHSATVGIVGMGYVGLPLAREFANKGFSVIGFDVDPEKVRMLSQGESYIHHIPADTIAEFIEQGRFKATDDFSLLSEADAILICVPTPLGVNREPDLSYVVSTTRRIAEHMRTGQLVVLESTTYPGTTEEVLRPILEETGLECGKDFFLAYSPEREDPGNPDYTAHNIPKVVGGTTPACSEAAAALYAEMAEGVVPVSGTREAEASKILENIYRAVNIALVNELKTLFLEMGIDTWEVIAAAATKPFGFQPFYPGPGLGGHCIPIDPFYLSWKAREFGVPTRFIELAGEINTRMPLYVVERTAQALSDRGKAVNGARVLVLGVAYKADVDDIRESPALEIITKLKQRGAETGYHDPFIPKLPPLRHYPDLYLESIPLTAETLAAHDAVIITTAHTNVDYELVVKHAPLVVDTRNATASIPGRGDKVVIA
jgi:UDP-N-acetyl-D-glucosamine dehydrogenase